MENKELETFEIRDEVLDLARNEMKKNILRKKRIATGRRIVLQSSMVILLLAILIIPLVTSSLHGGTSDSSNPVWFLSSSNTVIDFNALEKEKVTSIDVINTEKNQSFNWFKQGVRIETSQYTYNDEIMMVEEIYSYENLSVTLSIMNYNTNFLNYEMSSVDYNLNLEKDLSIISDEKNCYVLFYDVFKYYVKINSSSQETMIHIVDLLRG